MDDAPKHGREGSLKSAGIEGKLPLSGAKKVQVPKTRPDGTHAENLWVQDAVSPSIVHPNRKIGFVPHFTLDDVKALIDTSIHVLDIQNNKIEDENVLF